MVILCLSMISIVGSCMFFLKTEQLLSNGGSELIPNKQAMILLPKT